MTIFRDVENSVLCTFAFKSFRTFPQRKHFVFLTNEKNGETAICKVTLLKSNSKRLSHTAPLGCVETLQGTKSLEICESVFLTDIIL